MTEEEQVQQELDEATDRMSPATAMAIAAGVVLAMELFPTFGDLPAEQAAGVLRETVQLPFTLVTQVAAQSLFSSRWRDQLSDDAVSTGLATGREAGIRVMVNTAQHAARKARANPPSDQELANLKSFLSDPVVAAPASVGKFGGVDLMAQASSHGIQSAASSAAAHAAGFTHKTWNSREDRKVRPTHNVLDSHAWPEHTVPIDQPFISPAGAQLMFPGDPTAPLGEIANCRCWVTYSTPKHGESYGQSADLATNPPQMQGNPGVLQPV